GHLVYQVSSQFLLAKALRPSTKISTPSPQPSPNCQPSNGSQLMLTYPFHPSHYHQDANHKKSPHEQTDEAQNTQSATRQGGKPREHLRTSVAKPDTPAHNAYWSTTPNPNIQPAAQRAG